MRLWGLFIFCAGAGLLCAQPATTTRFSTQVSTSATSTAATLPFQLGIEVLESRNFDILQGQKVGLLTHAAAVARNGKSSIEILHGAPNVKLTALYAPEHGLDGQIKADVKFGHAVHEATGVTVYSLYGDTRKPTKAMLKDIDVMLVDLQDVGVRSYTFVSAMKLAMMACYENKIPVVVLDRPNPLGGLKVDGPVLNPKWRSYVGQNEVPYVHGLTIGELAKVAEGEIKPLRGSLTVVAMQGWKRRMLWSDIADGPKWRATSPAVPSVAAAYGYAITGLGCQLGGFRHGYGSEYPFRLLSHPKLPATQLKARLDAARIPGLAFVVTKTKKGDEGVYVKITNWNSAGVIELSLTLLKIAQEISPDSFAKATKNDIDLFNKHWGRDEPLHTLVNGKPLNALRLASHWRSEAINWQAKVGRQYWIYAP